MFFGASTWIWTSPLNDDRLAELIPKVAAMGFDLIELPLEEPGHFDYELAARLIRDHGLTVGACAVMAPGRDLIHPDAEVRAAGFAYLHECIQAAARLGARTLGGPMYATTGRLWRAAPQEREREWEQLVQALRELAQVAENRGVILCVEPLNRFETSFLNLVSQGIDLVDRVESPACKLLLDTFHMNIEEKSPSDAIRAAGTRIGHVHASENDRGTPGTGHVPWQEVANALWGVGYDGAVVIETFTDRVESIARAASVWRPLAPSQDDLASKGLAFLRSCLASPHVETHAP